MTWFPLFAVILPMAALTRASLLNMVFSFIEDEGLVKGAAPSFPRVCIRHLGGCFACSVYGEEEELPVEIRKLEGFAGENGAQLSVTIFRSIYGLSDDIVSVFVGPLSDQKFDQTAVPIKELHILPPLGRAMR
ncbi:hypothetical protein [Paracoccus marcusii]|uniref:hypothetical protein n=1 Tax=Paracoccus marcusii TaxID=59779 RepID=UPI001C3C3879|nr:hypothetical protein [Paracoccus marcusii]